ncbi:nuclear transport factor 2 family protein [Streptacidiphilus sp. PB12-B1b]|uniref:nuclear transport factor 2 family protein n=1 Tax=Streptacidiphilus sp. PB12-B1b TaxID=2705012 RepID=UPI0015F8B62F|nr:nuclear transport factor 2 family protein [Streptacidiphilus sp. PB12-B1b]QMU76458.1 nuclear transport factor 2 family protein [Streptacidiphilus sp. PB12-B1b]
MLTLQEMSDRMEIADLMVRYAHAVDTRDWPLFRELFTPDAVVDYGAFGGPKGSVEEVVAFLDSVLPLFTATQHLVANCAIALDGDRAAVRTMCHNPMALPGADGAEPGLLVCGLWYRDTVLRTPQGWRISERGEDKAYQIGLG